MRRHTAARRGRGIARGHDGSRPAGRARDGARTRAGGVLVVTRPQVVAHRGSSARHADNSWAAFEAAVAEGADAIECDVQATRDGVLVIRHDLALDGSRGRRAAARPSSARGRRRSSAAGVARLGGDSADRAAGRDQGSRRRRRGGRDGRRERVARPDRRRRSSTGPRWRRSRPRNAHVRTSFMMGSVVGADDLVRPRTGLPRRRRAPVLGKPRRRVRIGCSIAVTIEHAARVRPGNHAVARGARRRVARAGRASSPTPSAPTRRPSLRRIVDAHHAPAAGGASDAKRTDTASSHAAASSRHNERSADQRSIEPAARRAATRRDAMNWKHRNRRDTRRRAGRHRRRARVRRGRRDQGLVARGSLRAAARRQPRRRGRHAQQDARAPPAATSASRSSSTRRTPRATTTTRSTC